MVRRGVGLRRGAGSPLPWALLLLAIFLGLAFPATGRAQELADFDYEHLSFRGLTAEWGYLFPNRVQETPSLSVRADLGFLGPGVRVVTGVTHWSSFLVPQEVGRLEDRVQELVFEQSGQEVEVDLGRVEWSDVAVHADAHMMWRVPFGLITYAGLGLTAHVMSGGGRAVADTFVEDLLNSVRAGVNVHGGVEYPVTRWFRVLGQGRFEVLEDLRYLEFRVGGQLLLRDWVPGEGG